MRLRPALLIVIDLLLPIDNSDTATYTANTAMIAVRFLSSLNTCCICQYIIMLYYTCFY